MSKKTIIIIIAICSFILPFWGIALGLIVAGSVWVIKKVRAHMDLKKE